ncbi:DEAD/DEAH box helicase [Pontibacillus sp. HMF3514]|uniref:DEAD/DEAH box helicase n=1 Tax=Pontibacillus sp. HMF3514 TaxID=2692425 RepID=UPI00131F8308|nr:DEAD/DEAH box helicase [Pontibacillus sp. HMF3514]QHE51676.1 hypothetical protein GS400_06335 [Pontibacillus sp. HMF3514]
MTKGSTLVAPVSLLENWRREFEKFAPSLKVCIHQGGNRTGFYKDFLNFNVILTSYETILRDNSLFMMLNWHIVIADEAQAIKNPVARRTIAIKNLNKKISLAVTGTPIENNLIDLWSLLDFVLPGYIGELNHFKKTYTQDVESALELEPLVSPLILKRTVTEVAGDLPDKIEVPQVIELRHQEAKLYEDIREQIFDEYGDNANLVSLIKLRMFCAHPNLQTKSVYNQLHEFSKYERLIEIVEEIRDNNEKLIIFTSYKKMTDYMVDDLSSRFGLYCDFIDGRVDVTERQKILDAFSERNGTAILVLNPKAAGSGLNITAANHVIHYNLEWNPAIEDQASARAYRRGQQRPVTIHRLFCSGTVEEIINDRLNRKRDISSAAIIGTDGSDDDKADILQGLVMSPLTKKRAGDSY